MGSEQVSEVAWAMLRGPSPAELVDRGPGRDVAFDVHESVRSDVGRRSRSGARHPSRPLSGDRDREPRCASSEQPFEHCEISALRRGHKRVDELLLLAGADWSTTAAGEMCAGTGGELPGVRLGQPEHVRDPPVRVVEPFPEDVGRLLGRGQPFHEDEHRAFE
jgi:hypothetical protein